VTISMPQPQFQIIRRLSFEMCPLRPIHIVRMKALNGHGSLRMLSLRHKRESRSIFELLRA
ncbi:MAG: hypothetical protein OEV77_13735, partial [Nitrospira sp.]|nr:hypothetical protein [Nitrospira sp.]